MVMEVSTTTPIDAAPGESPTSVSAPVPASAARASAVIPLTYSAGGEPQLLANPLTGRGRIPSLDGLRALSITLVVFAHVFEQLVPPVAGRQYTPLQSALKIFANGGLGVAVFFVISGF